MQYTGHSLMTQIVNTENEALPKFVMYAIFYSKIAGSLARNFQKIPESPENAKISL